MKKVLAIILAAVLVLSCNMTAFANISGLDKDGKIISSSPVGDAQYVIANGGDKLEVTGTVDTPATVTTHPSVEAYTGGVIEIANDVIQNGTMVAIHAYDENTSVTVGGSVKGENVEATATTAYVNNGGVLSVTGNVENKSGGDAVKASTSSRVTVGGSIQESGAGNAITAEGGASVTVDRNVTEKGDGHAIDAKNNVKITVNGDVTEEGNGNAIYAQTGATVLVFGKVTGKDGGVAINADGGQVTVGGDVTSSIQARDNGDYSSSVLI